MVALGASLLAAVFFPALSLNGSRRISALLVLSFLILISPCLISINQPCVRLTVSLVAISLVTKLYDLHLGAAQGHRPGLRAFLAFLPNLALLVMRKADSEIRPRQSENLRRIAGGSLGLAAGVMALDAIFRVDWQRYPFWMEHGVKTTALSVVVVAGANAGAALWRLLGGIARDPMHHPLAAPTPAEFWRRWNRPAQQFLYEDVFKPAGGLRSPLRGTLLTFGVSALIHEYVFGIATGRIQGVQALFFILQGSAVAATRRVRPEGWRAVPWMAGTLAFNAVSSVLFFVSVNRIFPWYAHR
jgi:hypothetical protein